MSEDSRFWIQERKYENEIPSRRTVYDNLVISQSLVNVLNSGLRSVRVHYKVGHVRNDDSGLAGRIITRCHVAEHLSPVNTNPVEGGVRENVDVVPERRSLKYSDSTSANLPYQDSF